MGWTTGIRFPIGAEIFSPPRPGREADHSRPSVAEVKNVWSYTSTPLYPLMAWCSVKHRDNFTLLIEPRLISIAIRLMAGRPGFDSRQGQGRDFLLFVPGFRPTLRPIQPPMQCIHGVFPGLKRPGREADNSPPSIVVKNAWSYNSTPHYVFILWCSVEYRHNFTFTLPPACQCLAD
jgi:hypothetical protein